MFDGARLFNSALSLEGLGPTGKWTDASSMFRGAAAFNQPVGGVDTSSVTSMWRMFQRATAFNQPLNA